MQKSILIGPSSFGEIDRHPIEILKKSGYNVIENIYKRKIKKKELIKLLTSEVVGIIAGLEELSEETLVNSNVKIISRVGSGTSNVDFDFCKKKNIMIFSVPDGPTDTVAEITIANIINLFRSVHLMNLSMHSNSWQRNIGSNIKNKNIVIVGYGKIGKKVSNLLLSLGANIIVVDPVKVDEEKNIKQLNLHQALPIADLVTFHSSGDICLMNEYEFSILKKGALICNVARGKIISEKALIEALDKKNITGAWLDTFEEEPYNGNLANYDEVILTPHIGSYTKECRVYMENQAVKNLLDNI